MNLQPLETKTMADSVLERLRDAIITGRFSQGMRLLESSLAQSLGVSRGPVRTALAALEAEGLVVSIPHRGCRVVTIREEDIWEVYSLRGAIETLALEELFRRAKHTEIVPKLYELADGMEEASRRGQWPEVVALDQAFHSTICEASGHSRVLRVFNSLKSQVSLIVNMQAGLYASSNQMAENHRRIADAIAASNFEEARERLVANFRESVHYLTEQLRNRGNHPMDPPQRGVAGR